MKLCWLLSLHILILLSSSSNYVAQPVDHLTPVAFNKNVLAFHRQEPPYDFKLDYFWRARETSFDRLDFFMTILYDLSLMAAQDWNKALFGIHLPKTFGIGINFVSDRINPKLKIKHAMWTLQEIFRQLVTQERYATGNLVVNVGSTRLAVGNVQIASTRPGMNAVVENSANVSLRHLDMTTTQATNFALLSDDGLGLIFQGSSTTGKYPIANKTSQELTSEYAAPGGAITLKICYDFESETLSDVQVFASAFDLLVTAAQAPDMYGSIGLIFWIYNEANNFTIVLGPQLYAKSTELSWLDCINSIYAIVSSMASKGAEAKWEQVYGVIRGDANEIGRFCIEKGDLTKMDPRQVCTRQLPDEASVQ